MILVNLVEVKAMLFTEYNEEKILEKERQEGRQEAFETVAAALIREGEYPVAFIARTSQLSEDAVRNLARTMGIDLS